MAVISTNEQPDYAAEVVSRLTKDYGELLNSVSDILGRLRVLPKEIENDGQLDEYAKT